MAEYEYIKNKLPNCEANISGDICMCDASDIQESSIKVTLQSSERYGV